MTIKLQERYDLQPGRNRTLLQRCGDRAGVQGAFPAFLGYMEYLSMSLTDILKIDEASAARMDAVQSTHGYYPGAPNYSQQLNSRANFEWPDGVWRYRINMIGAHGVDIGQGSANYSAGSAFTLGTELTPDHANWVGLPAFKGKGGKPLRSAFVSAGHGSRVDETNIEYEEGFGVERIHLNGGSTVRDDSFEACAMTLTNTGSTSQLERCKTDGWNNGGINVIGAIPLTILNCRSFRNLGPALDLEGCVNGTVWALGLESDDNECIVRLSDGRNGASAGLKRGTFFLKAETGKGGKEQVIMDLRGQYHITAEIGSAVYKTARPEAAFILEQQHINSTLKVYDFACETGTQSTVGFKNLIRMGNSVQRMPAANEGIEFKLKAGVFMSDAR